MIRQIAFAVTALFTLSSTLLAQRPVPVGVRLVSLNSGYASTSLDSPLSARAALSACTQNRIAAAAVGAIFGAGIGWILYTFGLGALADSHGAGYYSDRARWMWAGAAIFAIAGPLEASRLPECQG